jgi:signal peptidase I
MDPTFESGQYLVVDQLTYHVRNPERGDVIVFKYPRNPETFFIKRIIGLPGDSVTINNGEITIKNEEYPDGFVLDETYYIDDKHRTYDNSTITLNDDEYFVMGDNRPQSSDSRVWGPLEEKYIVGRPIVRLFPVSSMQVLPGKQ